MGRRAAAFRKPVGAGLGLSQTGVSALDTGAAPALKGAERCCRVFSPRPHAPTPTAPRGDSASARPGSLGQRFRPGLWGKTGGRGPSSVPVQTRGWTVQRGPQAPGPEPAGVPASHRPGCTHRLAAPPPRSPRLRAHRRRTARARQPRRPLGDRPTQRGRGRLQARPREIAAGPAQPARSPPPAAPTLGALPGDPQLRAPAGAGRGERGGRGAGPGEGRGERGAELGCRGAGPDEGGAV